MVRRKSVSFVVKVAFCSMAGCNYSVSKQPEGGISAAPNTSLVAVPGFATVFSQVLQPKCATCHSSAAGNRGGINLETYAVIKSQLSIIRSAVDGGFMPPASRGSLSPADKAMLLAWIDAGAPQDPIAKPPNTAAGPPGGTGQQTTPVVPRPPNPCHTEEDDHRDLPDDRPAKRGDDDCHIHT